MGFASAQVKRSRQHINNAPSDLFNFVVAAYFGQDDGKLVTAQPCNRIGIADRLTQTTRRFNQQLITGGVPHAVIYRFEVIEIDIEQGKFITVAMRLGQHHLQTVIKQSTVREVGKRVTLRLVA